jgi:hypothetical protein
MRVLKKIGNTESLLLCGVIGFLVGESEGALSRWLPTHPRRPKTIYHGYRHCDTFLQPLGDILLSTKTRCKKVCCTASS